MEKGVAHNLGLLLFRVVAGGFMLVHGVSKLSSGHENFPDPLGIGSLASWIGTVGSEVGAATLLLLGAFTRLAAVPFAFTMAVAAFIVHGADPWAKKELAAMFCLLAIAIALAGPGKYSVDYQRERRRVSRG